jgi:hypothetical protein
MVLSAGYPSRVAGLHFFQLRFLDDFRREQYSLGSHADDLTRERPAPCLALNFNHAPFLID